MRLWFGGLPIEKSRYMSTTPVDNLITNQLVSASEGFGFQLLLQLMKQDVDKNVFISPFSIAIALAMTYNGAQGTTEQAMAEVLGLEGLSLEEINVANRSLLAMTGKLDAQIQLEVANSLWIKHGIVLDDDFAQRLRDAYASEVANVDFDNPEEAAAIINRWVEEKTQEKIKDLLKPSTLIEAIAVLVNAIYFKGSWTRQFDKDKTIERPFTLLDGTSNSHPMMVQSGYYLHHETEKFQAVSLPYGEGRVSMYVFLPRQSSSIEEFQMLLTAKNWQSWMSQFYSMEGNVVLPRFKVEYDTSLKDSLSALGMDVAFSDDANFNGMGAVNLSNMALVPLKISDVIHKAIIEVNEEGTVAAAATAVIMATTTSIMPSFSMIVDRPFFHAIRDNQTGALLFMGFVLDPTSDQTSDSAT